VFNEAFEPESDSDEGMFGDEVEVDRSHIQRLEVHCARFFVTKLPSHFFAIDTMLFS